MISIEVGKLTRVVTLDGRVYIGTLTGYAEVSQGEDRLQEIYLSGCGAECTTIQLGSVRHLDQSQVRFEFQPR